MNIDPKNTKFPEERRLATVLFADVQGFTALAEQLDFETVSDLIKGIWTRLDKIIETHGGYIDKHLGDGVMALWGAPFAGDKDAEDAVAAGLELNKSIEEFGRTSTIPGAADLKLRVGINTGLVFAGYVGLRREYTVIGDTVNVASRLEQSAEAGTVVIGENTLRMVRNSFRVKKLEPTPIKGKTEKIQTYAVEGHLAVPGRIQYQGSDSLHTNMVGRDEELKKMEVLGDFAYQAHQPIMLLINGEVGFGKSRLLLEYSRLLEAKYDGINILSARGLTQTSRIPYYLWRQLIRNRFGLRDDETLDVNDAKWTEEITDLWGSNDAGSTGQVTRVLGAMIGLYEESLGENQQKTVFEMTYEMLRRISGRRKTVILLDDLQWADRESLQLLNYLLTHEGPSMQLLIIGSARPEFLIHNTHWRNVAKVIDLPPLNLSADLIAQAYPDLENISAAIREEIAQKAESNPYFLEEIVKSLIKAGLLDQHLTEDEIQNRLLVQIPESLRATLQARLDNLSREARTVALLASVIGRIFWVGAILQQIRSKPLEGVTPMVNIPEAVAVRFVQDGLRQLVRAELAFPRSGSQFSDEQEYIFKNSYLRDVAYSLIPNRNRAQYHRAVAEWMNLHTDPAFLSMANDHEQNAIKSAKVSTGSLPKILES